MKLVKIILVMLLPIWVFAQDPPYPSAPSTPSNLTAAEYFFDVDPGLGNGFPISISTTGSDLMLSNVPLEISSLSEGVHVVFIRTQNANGEWSQTSNRTFLLEPDYTPAAASPPNIVGAEYFTSGSGLGGDPGFGQATAISVPTGQTDLTLSNEPVSISGLVDGINYVYLRTQNAAGEWSQTSIKEFTIVNDPVYPAAPPPPTDIVAAEYFFDDDPGFGFGESIPITAGQDISLSNYTLDVSSLGEGVHFVFLRTQNADGEWSQTSSKEFEIVLDFAYPPAPTAPADIVAAEYFFDTDPGFGSGIPISITSGPDISLANAPLDISLLNPGIHNVFLRTQNNNGQWSQTSNREFTIQEPTDCTSTSTWNGTTWSNGIPDATTNAIIDGDYSLTADAEWCRLDILNSSFTINQGVKLTLNDSFDALVLESTGDLDVEGVISSAGNIENNGTVQFKSTSTGTAQFDAFSSTIIGSGEITVERYIPAKRAFRLLSSPLTTTDFIFENWQENGSTPSMPDGLGTHITGGNASLGFDQSGTNNPSMFTFNNGFLPTGSQTQFDAWTVLPSTNTTRLNAGEAYLTFVRGDRSIDLNNNSAPPNNTTLSATGDLYFGSLTYNVGNPIEYLNLSSVDNFYNLIANPYQAVVNFETVNRSGLTDFIYVWDASIAGENGRGGYVTVDVTGATIPPNPFSSDASKYIAPGMSFFIQNDNIPGNAGITFNEADKATEQNPVTVFDTYPHFYINSRLYQTSNLLNGDTENDALGLRFSNNYTTIGNNNEDATKLTNPDETYAVVNNGLRSIDKQEIPTLGHVIDFSITNYTETNYSLTFVLENKPNDLGVFLNDAYLNTQTELTQSFVYDFTVDANIPDSIASDRFKLVFDNTTLSINEYSFGENFRLYPNPTANGEFSIVTPGLSGEVNVEISNLLGQQVYEQGLYAADQEVNVKTSRLASGIYIVKLAQGNQSFTTKLIVE